MPGPFTARELPASLRAAVADLSPAGSTAGPAPASDQPDLWSTASFRVNDAERERAAERIRLAFVDGRLSMAEFDRRTGAAWSATTRADLDAITHDLPASTAEPAPPAPPATPIAALPVAAPTRRRRGGAGLAVLRAIAMVWLVASVTNIAIWTLVCVSTLDWHYPWWLWIVVPPGAALWAVHRMVFGPPED